jgi:hypothetical protein
VRAPLLRFAEHLQHAGFDVSLIKLIRRGDLLIELVVVDRNVVPYSQGPVMFLGPNQADFQFINNVFVALDGAPLIEGTATGAKSNFDANDYR